MPRKHQPTAARTSCYSQVAVVSLGLLAGCSTSTGILPAGPDTYTVSEARAPIRGGGTEAKRIAMTEANSFCEQQNRIFVPLSLEQIGELTNPVEPPGYTATFQCRLPANAPEPKPDAQQAETTTAPAPSNLPQNGTDSSLDWLSDVRLLPGEQRGQVSSDNNLAYFVSKVFRTTAEATRIVFVHEETKLPNPKFGYFSSRDTWEIDCAQHRSRLRAATGFSGRNLEGSIVIDDTWVGIWNYDAPGTMGDGVDSMVCATSQSPTRHTKHPTKAAAPKPDMI